MSKYLLNPKLGSIKQAFFLNDENGNLVYEGKMIKFSLLGASPFEFINHLTTGSIDWCFLFLFIK